ncbi:MAG: CehA/McbA family metallohydrolase [Acetivibrio sp.]
MTKFSVGDVITLTGVTSDVNGVRQVSYTGAKLVKKATPLAPQTVTIEELKANSEKYVSEYIRIKEVTLSEYNKDILPITDVNGNTMNVWKAAAYPHDMKMGDKGEFYGVYAKQDNTLYCLRSGMMGNSWALGYLVDTECVLPIAKWEGSSLPAQVTSLKVNADSDIPGDELDDNSSLSVSTGKAPNYTNTSSTPKEYYLGYTGLVNNDYYQLETTASKYGNMSLKFQMRGSGTGPKNFEILYSTDGVNYKNSTNINYNVIQFDRTAGTTISTEYKDKSVFEVSNGYLGTVFVNFPREVNNEPKLYIRIQVTADSTTLAGKPLKNTAGVNRFVHINISGSPLIGDDICSTVSMNPKSKAVALNETVDLIPRTMGSTVYFSVNGSAYTIYTDNNKPIASVFPCTISAYAVKKNMSKSIKTTENYTQAQVGTVRFAPNGGNITTGSAVKLSCATLGAKIEYSTDKGITWAEYKGDPGIVLNQLPASIMAKATCVGYLPSEIKSVNFASRENEDYRTYFGQIHSHTNISDGSGTIDDAYEYASTKAKQIDYLVVTDHSNLFDNDTAATMINGSASTEWVTAHQAAKKYTSDKFVGLYGYEMTWSGGAPGHMNTYNTDGFLSRNDDGFKNGSLESLPNYYAELKKVPNSISQFNHPGNTFGDFYDFSYFDEAIDQQISLIEVGNGEGAVGSSGYFPSYEYYTRALDKGWHVAPTNNQDNHKGRWGDANTGRTVILADSLTESNIYDALRNMRVYATEDNNLKIKYTLNNEIMGTILSDKPENIKINVDLSDEDKEAIGKVEVIVNGGLSVASNTVSENAGKVEFNLSPDYSYYYIRVTQADGNIAVTAPVWTSSVESIGVSSISTKATLAVKGEDINVDTTLFNNEQDDFIVSSVKYTVGEGEKEREIHQVNLENNPQMQVVGAGQTPSYSFQYAHDGLGTTNINVIVKGTYQGVEKTYRGMLTLKYIAPEMTTNIVIDGTHDNDYVTGYNAGKMSNLVGIAAEKFAKVRVEETEITDSVLENCNLLIIAAPDRNVTKKFSDDFIETVKKYVERGGSVILCGAADKSDNINVQSSTELNRLLTAMGATTRLNSDQLQENNANNLNFSAFNIYSKHTKNLVQGQKYSAYNSCSVLLNEAAIAEGKAEALVYANEAVKSISNNSFGTNVPLADGTAVALAHEQVGTGSVFVAGAVFVSDYEIEAEVDYAGQLHSMNRSIFENILHEKKTRIPTSEIAQVRKSGLNEAFAVEGYVTAGTAVPGNVFFDAIYVQDDTAGITVFPIADTGIEIGQKIRLEGYVDAYQGDKEIQIFSYELLDGEKKAYEPRRITTEQAGNYEENGGLLVRISGEVTNIIKSSGIVQYIYVRDNTGKDGIVFADGYILPSDAAENEGETLVVGDKVSATGLVYEHPEGAVQQTCLRVRDRSEITKTDLITLGQKVASAAAIDVSLCSELAKENLQKAISNAQAAIDRNETNLIVLDDCRMAITKAVKMLWSTVGADYTAVNNAISSGRQINRQWYTRESLNVLDLAINAVIMGKDKSEQETVNAYAAAIYKAITMLVYKGADYSAVDAALKEAKKLDKDDFTEESWKELEKAMETVIIGKTILEQEEVNAYAAAIRFAIGKLQNIETEDEYIPEITTDDKEEDKDKEDLDKETSGKPGIVEIKTMDKVVTSIELNAISAQEKKDGFFYSEDGKKLKDAIIKTEDGKRFILNEKGEKYLSAMVESKAGTKYIVGETGAIITGSFIKTKGEIYYTTKSTGKIVTEKLIKVDGRKYYATSTGAFATGEILEIKGNLYYVTKKSGKVVENQLIKIDGKKYYAKKGGKLAASRWILVDGKKYYCNKEGIVTKTK